LHKIGKIQCCKGVFMASPPMTLARRATPVLLPAIIKLAWWRLRQMWRVLLVTWLGMVSMVVLICSVPLFTQVSTSAGLRSELTSVSLNQQRISVSFISTHPTSDQVLQARQEIDREIQSNLGPYVHGSTHLSVSLPTLTVQTASSVSSPSQNTSLISIMGYELNQVGSQLTVLQGRLPATFSDQVEIALTEAEARNLKVGVGSVITASFPDSVGQVTWTLHVVGIFATTQSWEYQNNFQIKSVPSTGPQGPGSGAANSPFYPVLASSSTLLPQIAPLQINNLPDRQLFGKDIKVVGIASAFFDLNWSYPFDVSHIDANQLGTLLQNTTNLSTQLRYNLQSIQGASFFQPGAEGAIFSVLSAYSLDTALANIPITAFLVLILSLVLFLVSTMAVALVERQTSTIAILRSRGATRRHVFGAFTTQGIGLGLLAMVLGPFIALLLVDLLVPRFLPTSAQSSLNLLTNNPVQEVLSVGWFAVVATVCAVLTVILAVRRSATMDVLAFRRESARSTRRPFWRRLNLDIIGVILLCLGYAGYLYLSQPAISQQLGRGLLALLGLMSMIAPFLACAVCFTLFLRLFPLFLRLCTRIAGGNRKAPAVLAFAQMERAPRSASRMILLLSLVIATAMFIFAYTATQQQRTVDAANFAVGADFSGASMANTQHLTLAQETALYRRTHGVTSATLGYTDSFNSKDLQARVNLVVADANTYASTAFWTSQYSHQSLSSLTSLLVAHRADALNNDTVAVIIDDAMAQTENFSVGSSFLFSTSDGYSIHAVVVAQVHALPSVYDNNGVGPTAVGLLCDYQSYAAVYAKNSGNTLDPNFVWLKTASDASSLSSVRRAYPTLEDRRALITSNQTNPLYVNVIGVLDLSIATALLLALIGVLFFSWLNASGRLTNFAVLRALGMAPRQIAAVLLWEQGSIYILALLLGLTLGSFLQTFIGPALVFTDIVTGLAAGFSSGPLIYSLPVQLVTPIWLIAGVLGGLVLICGIALALMARLVSRPSLGQILRLNED
jgi:ABC-type lipoprotein release transport system permease subunit